MAPIDIDAVVALLQADDGLAADGSEIVAQGEGDVAAQGVAGLVLLFLVAVHGVEQIVGEVVPQGHGRVDDRGV